MTREQEDVAVDLLRLSVRRTATGKDTLFMYFSNANALFITLYPGVYTDESKSPDSLYLFLNNTGWKNMADKIKARIASDLTETDDNSGHENNDDIYSNVDLPWNIVGESNDDDDKSDEMEEWYE